MTNDDSEGMDDHDDEDFYGHIPYRNPDEIGMHEITQALKGLHLLGGDMFLTMQITNLAIVDQFIMTQETELLQTYRARDRTPMDLAMFVSAQSQMWIFAAYELMRTWRSRAKDTVKLARNGGLEMKAKALEVGQGFMHMGREARARELREIIANPSLIQVIEDDLKRAHIPFKRMEFIRVSLAKHEVSGKPKAIAYAPGYGRINMYCGALDFQMTTGRVILGDISRRDIADEIRAIPQGPIPSAEQLAAFDEFMALSDDAVFPAPATDSESDF
ncbi:hypothetical protein [Rhizobium sp. NZLR1]|uniref:hypothetical protein n=1 Tax=Rhizobium sp. NZLR1 TaxID=2731096 RepID=UPI001A983E4C|nr:hypothetical protein [Rhizobium sp. NZLR1]MBX5205835.1 hypothetical protein [Rhizobium sp. NZLR1]QSZ20261.1 hypothetical protein J3O30_18375 [Rhizobium sp. NZLR1]